MGVNKLIGREHVLFAQDIVDHEKELCQAIRGAACAGLVFGGAGSIGKEVVTSIFRRGPSAWHVIDISENNAVSTDRVGSIVLRDEEALLSGVEYRQAVHLSTNMPYKSALEI